MNRFHALTAVFLLPVLTGCNLLRAGVDDAPPRLYTDGLVESHIAVNGFGEPKARFIDLDLFDRGLVALDIWPIGGFEIGVVGARVQILPFSLGVGTLFHDATHPMRSDPVIPDPVLSTLIVENVVEGSQAADLGLEKGDILRTYGGTHIRDYGHLRHMIRKGKDDHTSLVVHRPTDKGPYRVITLKVKPGKLGVVIRQTQMGEYEVIPEESESAPVEE